MPGPLRRVAALPTWTAALLAAGVGALAVFGFAPLAWYPLVLLSIAGLYVLWSARGWRDAAWLGFAFGVGWFGAGIHWVWYSAYAYGGTPLPVAILVNALLVLVLAAYPAWLGWLARRFVAGIRGVAQPLLLATLWVWLELLRAVLFTGFGWLNPGYALIDTSLAGFAPLGGVNLVALAGLASVLVIVAVVIRQADWRWLAFPLALWLLGSLLGGIAWTERLERRLDVALIQGNVDQARKWQPGERLATIALYERLTRQNLGADLVIWPETALPVFLDQALSVLADIDDAARARGTGLLIGAPVRENPGEPASAYFNGLVAMGAASGIYTKRHLVPFGEYVPLAGLLGGIIQFLDVPMSNFGTGAFRQVPIRLRDGLEISATICFEDAFAAETHAYLGDPVLMVNVSNDAWFGPTWAPAQHLQMARMRALEARQLMARATNTGLTAVIDATGHIVDMSRPWEIAVLRSEIPMYRGKTPFVRFGDGPIWLFTTLIVLIICVRNRCG